MLTMLARNSFFAGVQAIVTSLSLFAMYHLVSRHVGVQVLGFWSVAAAISSLASVVDCGVPDATVRQVAERRGNGDSSWTGVVATAVLFVGTVLAASFVLAWPAVAWAVRYVFSEVDAEGSYLFAAGALFVGWSSACATTVQGVVEGLERYDVRCAASVLSNVVALIVAFTLIPAHGAAGFVAGLVIQSLANLIVQGAFIAGQARRSDGVAPSVAELRQLVAVGLPLRVASLSYYAFEPLTRVFVGRFGGAEMAGIFEGASRLLGQLRAMIVSAAQVLVPRFTMLHAVGDASLAALLQSVTQRIRVIAVVCMTGMVLLLPVMSYAIVARVERDFVLIGTIMAAAWYMNLRSLPAYFANLAQRRQKWNLLGHVALGFVNVTLGYLLGRNFGAIGVAVGTALALTAASQIVVWSRRARERTVGPKEDWALLLVSGLLALGVGALAVAGGIGPRSIPWSLGAATVYVIFVLVNQYPMIACLQASMRRSNG